MATSTSRDAGGSAAIAANTSRVSAATGGCVALPEVGQFQRLELGPRCLGTACRPAAIVRGRCCAPRAGGSRGRCRFGPSADAPGRWRRCPARGPPRPRASRTAPTRRGRVDRSDRPASVDRGGAPTPSWSPRGASPVAIGMLIAIHTYRGADRIRIRGRGGERCGFDRSLLVRAPASANPPQAGRRERARRERRAELKRPFFRTLLFVSLDVAVAIARAAVVVGVVVSAVVLRDAVMVVMVVSRRSRPATAPAAAIPITARTTAIRALSVENIVISFVVWVVM